MHRYPNVAGQDLRNMLAERHGVEPGRLILGNGAAELLSSATRALIEPGQQLLTLWPSYPLYPLMARRAHGQAVRVSGGVDELLAAAQDPAVRAIAIANPNDPTGELIPAGEIERLLAGIPDGVAVLLDEALVEFADAQPTRASLDLLAKSPRLLVFRTFSKAWGLAGLRIGYAIGVSQAGALEALRTCSELLENRVKDVCRERPVLIAGLRERGFEVADSQANFVWAAHPSLSAGELSSRLEGSGILIAPGDALGEPGRARIAIHSDQATQRLLAAIDKET
jgi:histidinol-phosphate aminotransferase